MATRSAPHIPPFRPRARTQFWNYPRPYRTGIKAWLPSWRFVVGVMLAGAALCAGVVMAAWTSITVGEQISSASLETSIVKFAGDGGQMAEFRAEQDRKIVTVDDLPIWVANAPVASEEKDFYSENNLGISPRGILRAAMSGVGGGSTLTQQYVEQYYVGWDPNPSLVDKFEEMILAMKIRQDKEGHPPEVILDGYLNVINLGRSSYGIQAAAQAYYGKDAKDLTPSEAAFLAGIIPSPNRYDEAENGPAWAEQRWDRTLRLMHEQGYVDDDQYETAVSEGFPEPKEHARSSSMSGPTGYILQEIERELKVQGFNIGKLQTDGLVVETTIDKKLQKAAEKNAKLPKESNKPFTRSSLVSIDPKTGAVRAMYGGPDLTNQKYVQNAATDNWQQGGSTYKPFTLIAALESGIPLGQKFNGDEPQTFDYYTSKDEDGVEQPQPVTNFGNEDFGQIDLVDATTHSVNTVYVQLNHEATPEKSQEVAKELGLGSEGSIAYRNWVAKGENPDEPVGETSDQMSNVLGTPYVYTYDLARAYATIANQGVRTTPHIVSRVVDPGTGEAVYEADFPEEKSNIDPQSIANATYAMSNVIDDPEGSGHFARSVIPEERPLAGKTGTSNDNYSAWFAGFTPQLATVVGLYEFKPDSGDFTPITPFGGFEQMTGGTWPVQAWTKYMDTALEGEPIEEFPDYEYEEPSPPPSQTPDEEMVQVPTGLEGQPWSSVREQLIALGLNPQPKEVEHPGYGPETVVRVPQAGQEVTASSSVEVEVTGGEEQSTVPNVVGMDENQARVTLQQAGFQMHPNYVSSEKPGGTVIDQNPGGDQQLPQGQGVNVDISDGSGGGDPSDDATCGIWKNEPCDESGGEPTNPGGPSREPGPNGNGDG